MWCVECFLLYFFLTCDSLTAHALFVFRCKTSGGWERICVVRNFCDHLFARSWLNACLFFQWQLHLPTTITWRWFQPCTRTFPETWPSLTSTPLQREWVHTPPSANNFVRHSYQKHFCPNSLQLVAFGSSSYQQQSQVARDLRAKKKISTSGHFGWQRMLVRAVEMKGALTTLELSSIPASASPPPQKKKK